MRKSVVIAVMTIVAVGVTALQAGALVVCTKKSGAVFLREACKKKETSVDPASFGATGPQGPTGPAGTPAEKIDFRVPVSTSSTVLFDSGKLQLSADCSALGVVTLTATTSVDHATIHSYGNSSDTDENDFLIGGPLTLGSSVNEERDVVYTEPGGQVVVLQYLIAQTGALGGTVACLVSGVAIVR